MTIAEAEESLTDYAATVASRDERVRAAVAVGVSKHRVHILTGIARTTIDTILASDEPGEDQHDPAAQDEKEGQQS